MRELLKAAHDVVERVNDLRVRGRWRTFAVWTVALTCLAITGAIAGLLALMPVSLDPTEMIEAGADPWATALNGGMAFLALFATTAAGLALWHRPRLRWLGLGLIAIEAVATGWACAWVVREYM